MTALTQLSGPVSFVNGTGFKLEGREGYLNISRFAEPRPELPEVGQHVTLGLDAQGYVRTLEHAPSDEGTDSRGEAPPQGSAPPATGPAMEITTTRLACLQAAAVFCASRPEAKSPDVLEVAARFEAWLTR